MSSSGESASGGSVDVHTLRDVCGLDCMHVCICSIRVVCASSIRIVYTTRRRSVCRRRKQYQQVQMSRLPSDNGRDVHATKAHNLAYSAHGLIIRSIILFAIRHPWVN